MLNTIKSIIESIDITIVPDNLNKFQEIIFYEIILLSITLLSILRLAGYFITFYIIKHHNLEEKYTILGKMIQFYKKLSYIYIIYDICFIIIVYVFIIILNIVLV